MSIRAGKICSAEGCERFVLARNLCRLHYDRQRKHGTYILMGKSDLLPGTARHFFYTTALNYDGDECLIWPFYRDPQGYARVHYNGRQRRVTRLICENAYGAPPAPEYHAAHSCGKGHLGCISKKHLRWATPAENVADRTLHGTDNRGERSGHAKLNRHQVKHIRSLKGRLATREIAKMFNVSQTHVSIIQRRLSWRWL